MNATDYLRLMYKLLVARYQEYDKNGHSALYCEISSDYERAKAAWRLAKANATD